MAIQNRPIGSPSAFQRTDPLRAAQAPQAAQRAQSAAPAAQDDNLALLQTRLQSSLNLGQNLPDTSRQAGQLNEALNQLRQLTNSGPNASISQVLERFRSDALPQNLAQLNTARESLQSRLDALPAEAPERRSLETELQATQTLLGLYQDARILLNQSPVLTPAGAGTAGETPAGPEPAPAPASAAAAAETADPSPPAAPTPSRFLSGLGIPPQTSRNYRAYDVFNQQPQSPQTIFNQRSAQISQNLQQLDAQIQSLSAAGGHDDDIAALQRSRAVLTHLDAVYAEVGHALRTGAAGGQADVQRLNGLIQGANEALTAAVGDLDPQVVSELQGQLGDLSTATTSYLTFKGSPADPGNLGLFLNSTFKRLAEIQAGDRTREAKTIQGALQTYSNDASDLVVFAQRFSDLRDQIQSGHLSPADAHALALRGVPGTSRAFQTEYLKLVDSELALKRAQEAAAAARRDNQAANVALDRADRHIDAAEAQTAAGQQASRTASGAAAGGNLGQAQLAAGRARDLQTAGAAELASGQADVAEARRLTAAAQRETATARVEVGRSTALATSAAQGVFGQALAPQAQQTLSHAGAVRADVTALEAQVATTEARVGASETRLASATLQNQALAASNAENDERIAELSRQQQEAANHHQLEAIDQFVDSDTYGHFRGDFGISVKAGEGVSVSAGAVISIEGEKNLEGEYALNISISGKVSAEVEAYLFELKGSLSAGVAGGIRLRNADEVRQLVHLIERVSNQLGKSPPDAAEISASISQVGGFLADHRETAVVYRAEASVETPGHQDFGLELTRADLTTHVTEDRNHDGIISADEKGVERKTKFSVSGEYASHGRGLALEGEVYRNGENGEITYQQYSVAVTANFDTQDAFLALAGGASRAGVQFTPAQQRQLQSSLARLESQAHHGGLTEAGVGLKLAVSIDHHGRVVTRLLETATVDTKERTVPIPVTPGITGQLEGRFRGNIDHQVAIVGEEGEHE